MGGPAGFPGRGGRGGRGRMGVGMAAGRGDMYGPEPGFGGPMGPGMGMGPDGYGPGPMGEPLHPAMPCQPLPAGVSASAQNVAQYPAGQDRPAKRSEPPCRVAGHYD